MFDVLLTIFAHSTVAFAVTEIISKKNSKKLQLEL